MKTTDTHPKLQQALRFAMCDFVVLEYTALKEVSLTNVSQHPSHFGFQSVGFLKCR
jgi:hypothetical protein